MRSSSPSHDYAPASRVPRAFESRLALLFAHAGFAVESAAEDEFAALGITGLGYIALAVLAEDQPGSQLELATACGKAPAQMVALVDDLAGKGLVERERDPADRRRSIVRLTPTGAKVLAAADDEAARVEAELLVALSKDERAQLHDLLRRALSAAPAQPAG